jgi:hypothetical protein
VRQPERNRNEQQHPPQGSSLAYARRATLSLIGFVAVSAALVGIVHAQIENRTGTITGLAALEWHDIADQREVFDEALNSER